ncbi:hypothetical protein NDU88_004947 [Pleurodeles waltl]|uniref:Uncharacterized protein n=1 Tax=Pleurodeles waltl TaxID=8319 RepID=A0AAV7SKE1_PLEWA|nr:hypothetical protein NDU88_004947 [Pleurodeles waltl]
MQWPPHPQPGSRASPPSAERHTSVENQLLGLSQHRHKRVPPHALSSKVVGPPLSAPPEPGPKNAKNKKGERACSARCPPAPKQTRRRGKILLPAQAAAHAAPQPRPRLRARRLPATKSRPVRPGVHRGQIAVRCIVRNFWGASKLPP